MELKLFEKTLAYNIEAREKLKIAATNFGFKQYYYTNKKMFSLYEAISISLKNSASYEHLLQLAVRHFLDAFASNNHNYIIYNFYEIAAKSFNNQEALKSLASVLRRNIVIISSNQNNPEVYKIKDTEETIYIGLEAETSKHFRYYKPLIKVLDNKDIENYLIHAKEVEATEYKSIINLFERKDIKKLLDEIIKRSQKK